MHQFAAQVVHRGVPAQIIPIRKIRVIEKRVFPGSGRLIVRKERAFMQPSEKERVSRPALWLIDGECPFVPDIGKRA